jgi:hypothetical protein
MFTFKFPKHRTTDFLFLFFLPLLSASLSFIFESLRVNSFVVTRKLVIFAYRANTHTHAHSHTVTRARLLFSIIRTNREEETPTALVVVLLFVLSEEISPIHTEKNVRRDESTVFFLSASLFVKRFASRKEHGDYILEQNERFAREIGREG